MTSPANQHNANAENGVENSAQAPVASAALKGLRVLDLTRVRSGPTCVRQLADWGADVIKIEAPVDEAQFGGPRHGPDFQNLHRNKRSLTIDLKSPAGVAALKRLPSQASHLTYTSDKKCISILRTPSPWQDSHRPPLTLNENRPGV